MRKYPDLLHYKLEGFEIQYFFNIFTNQTKGTKMSLSFYLVSDRSFPGTGDKDIISLFAIK